LAIIGIIGYQCHQLMYVKEYINMSKIVKVDTSTVKTNKNNPRSISSEKMELLKSSIVSFPNMIKVRPLIVNKDMEVLGGNMRLEAYRQLEIKEVYVIVADMTEEEAKEFIIKDNIGYGEWDYEKLLDDYDFGVLGSYGIDIPQSEINLTTEEFTPDAVTLDSYEIIFSTEEEQELFFDFLVHLKDKFSSYQTVSERVSKYIEEVYEENNMTDSKAFLSFLKIDGDITDE